MTTTGVDDLMNLPRDRGRRRWYNQMRNQKDENGDGGWVSRCLVDSQENLFCTVQSTVPFEGSSWIFFITSCYKNNMKFLTLKKYLSFLSLPHHKDLSVLSRLVKIKIKLLTTMNNCNHQFLFFS